VTSTQPGRSQGYAPGRAKRREILDAATALYGEVGYRSASLREIATRSNLSHPGLLHYFPTKEALLLAVLEHRDAADSQWLPAAGVEGLNRLRRQAGLVALNATRPSIVELYAVLSAEATSTDHPAHMYFVRRYADLVAELQRAYGLAQAAGQLRPEVEPAAAGRQLVAVMDGLQVQWLLDEAIDMAALVRAHLTSQLTVPL
jgi:AcrR family transcriptional regulator